MTDIRTEVEGNINRINKNLRINPDVYMFIGDKLQDYGWLETGGFCGDSNGRTRNVYAKSIINTKYKIHIGFWLSVSEEDGMDTGIGDIDDETLDKINLELQTFMKVMESVENDYLE